MLRDLIKRLLFPVLDPWAKWYFSKPRTYRYKDLKVVVNPGVFFPHMTISTKLLLQYVDGLELKGKRVLELGAGCGIISLRCAQHGAQVTASDISHAAIENITQNSRSVNANIRIIHSDLFDVIDDQFGLIIINPPYYPKDPKTEAEKAWFCGEELQYFKKLGVQLSSHLSDNGKAIMILSEDCPIGRIDSEISRSGLKMKETHRWRKLMEYNFLFELRQPQ